MNQLYVYIYPHIPSLFHLLPTLPIPPLSVVTKHRADLPVLCSCFPLVICFTFRSVYMSMLLSHFIPAYPSPSPCPQVHSLHLRLIPVLPLGSSEPFFFFFRFHIYVLAYSICFSLEEINLLWDQVISHFKPILFIVHSWCYPVSEIFSRQKKKKQKTLTHIKKKILSKCQNGHESFLKH